MKVSLPRGIVVETNNIPADFDTMILEEFKTYTQGTNPVYTYQDKLSFIDRCVRCLHKDPNSEDEVKNLILRTTEWQLGEYGELPDAYEFWNLGFMEDCYLLGRKHASLYDHYTGDHHFDDTIMKLLFRIVKVVINYEVEEENSNDL